MQSDSLLEWQPEIQEETGLEIVDSLIRVTRDKISRIVLVNRYGFSQTAEEGSLLGEATPVAVVTPGRQSTDASILRVGETNELDLEQERVEERWKKLKVMLADPDLPDLQRQQLLIPLKEHHGVFSVEEGE